MHCLDHDMESRMIRIVVSHDCEVDSRLALVS